MIKSEIGVMTDVMPIVYTVRTRNQAGTFMDDVKGVREMKELLVLGVRSGVEVLDVEAVWGEEVRGDESFIEQLRSFLNICYYH